jgi:hypothetical protein
MVLPTRVPTPAPRFTREHQTAAARARHLVTASEHVTFVRWLDQARKDGTLSGCDLARFVSIVRCRIRRGCFASAYTVTADTLCAWLRQWRKVADRSAGQRELARP